MPISTTLTTWILGSATDSNAFHAACMSGDCRLLIRTESDRQSALSAAFDVLTFLRFLYDFAVGSMLWTNCILSSSSRKASECRPTRPP